MESKCKIIKTSIDFLLVELSNQLSQSKNQGLQEQVCNPLHNSSMLNSELAEQACPTESDRNDHIDLVHTEHRRRDPLVGRGDYETSQKCFDRKSTALKKEVVLNYSSDDQQYEIDLFKIQPEDDQSINLSLEKVQTKFHIKENDLFKNDTHNNLIVQNMQNDLNQDLQEIPKKFVSYDEDQIKYNGGSNNDRIRNQNKDRIRNQNKDRIRNQIKDESNMEKIKEYQEANKDRIRNQIKKHQEANKDRIRNQRKDQLDSRKDKIKDYQKSNKDKLRNKSKEYQEANKDKIRNKSKKHQEANKDKIMNQNKIYREANKEKLSKKNIRENRIKDYRRVEHV